MSILRELKNIYPSSTISKPHHISNPDDFSWYKTSSMETIGIKKSEMNQRESTLLPLFLTPIRADEMTMTEREEAWYHFVKGSHEQLPIEWPAKYRFVFFSLTLDDHLNKDNFHEALLALFPQQMPLVWENNHEGFIIEELHTPNQETIAFQNVIDVLMSDFYTNIRFYISDYSEDVLNAPSLFEWSETCYKIATHYQIAPVVTCIDVIPYLYIHSIPSHYWHHMKSSLLKDVQGDDDLLRTIRVFLEAGSNATLASKQLYMHRNSLQYRVDKFIEKTGIDVKQFQGALTVYLALLKKDE